VKSGNTKQSFLLISLIDNNIRDLAVNDSSISFTGLMHLLVTTLLLSNLHISAASSSLNFFLGKGEV